MRPAKRIVVKPFLAAVRALEREKQHLHASIVSALSSCTRGWDSVRSDDVNITHIGGAMTNLIFHASKPNGDNADVIVRIYGEGTDSFFSRMEEIRVFQLLSAQNIGVALLGEFENGRVEKRIDGYAIDAKLMRNALTSQQIAQQLRRFHELDVDMDKKPRWKTELYRLLALARTKYRDGIFDTDDAKVFFDQYERDIDNLQHVLSRIPSPLVLSHNDLQYGNIMSLKDNSVVLIDFEYCSYNPRGYDIGNHFCEWAFDYHKSINPHIGDFTKYPSIQQQRHFCRAYLTSNFESSREITDEQVDGLCMEANAYSQASHLLWALWGLIQASQSEIDFDYMSYAQCRYEAYKKRQTFPRDM
ncbi:unnamed protein product [Albugo candida]|uniref:Choline kinase N-terminal domain-containing protein n=1 Tax=Albugo candida TaxID=65357 RepID=A0A024G3S1_9STRA|nr:unnamed protein product [Albugo candida]|eukprot:CCI41498.1 unnamed protein product [Albugo candida]